MDWNTVGIETNFSSLDWCIVVGYLIIIVAVGVYIKRYISNVTDFIVAGRGLKTFLAIATMIGTELGLVTVMYSSQKGFTGGFAAFHIALAAAIVTLIVGLTGFIVVPLRRLNVMTIPEFYEKRFGRGVRILGGIILAFSGILNMGMFLKAGSLFVMGITGLNLLTSIS
jgi:SSS family solute:Na+ symporter